MDQPISKINELEYLFARWSHVRIELKDPLHQILRFGRNRVRIVDIDTAYLIV